MDGKKPEGWREKRGMSGVVIKERKEQRVRGISPVRLRGWWTVRRGVVFWLHMEVDLHGLHGRLHALVALAWGLLVPVVPFTSGLYDYAG